MDCASGRTRVQADEIERTALALCIGIPCKFDGINLWFSK